MLAKNDSSKVPKLRFPDFSEEWVEQKLSQVLKIKNLRNYNNKFGRNDVLSVSGTFGIINQVEHLGRSFAGKDLSNYHVVKYGNIVYTKSPIKRNPFGIIKANKNKSGIVSTLYAVYETTEGNDFNFVDRYFELDDRTNKYLRPLVHIGAKNDMKINNERVLIDPVVFPKLKEQQKISLFLLKVDEWIENLKKQREEWEKYKKGITEKIFSQKIKFKDKNGKDFPLWKRMHLDNFLKERKLFSVKGKGYKHISLTVAGIVPKSERYDRDFLVSNDIEKGYKVTKYNDLCYNPANLKFGVIALNKLGPGIFSPIYVTFEIINGDPDFIGFYLCRPVFINKARRYEQGTIYERMAVNPTDFMKVKVLMPSLLEQQKIAEFLTSLDKVTESYQKQIDFAENWKKGLMQRMFI